MNSSGEKCWYQETTQFLIVNSCVCIVYKAVESGVICEEKDDESVKMRKRKRGVCFVCCINVCQVRFVTCKTIIKDGFLMKLSCFIYYRTFITEHEKEKTHQGGCFFLLSFLCTWRLSLSLAHVRIPSVSHRFRAKKKCYFYLRVRTIGIRFCHW